MSARPELCVDLLALQAEMRRILPSLGPKRSQTYRDVRAENQARFDAAMQARQRPTRVS
jgi:hypothetical protein